MLAYGDERAAQALEEAAQSIESQDTNGDYLGGWQEIFAAVARSLIPAIKERKKGHDHPTYTGSSNG